MHVAPFTPALYRTYHHLGTNEKIGRNCLVLYRVAPPELSWTDVKKFSRNREPRISKKAKKEVRAINTGNYSSRIKSIRPLCRLRVHGLLAVSLLFKPDSIRINNDLDSARTSMHGVTARFNFCCSLCAKSCARNSIEKILLITLKSSRSRPEDRFVRFP